MIFSLCALSLLLRRKKAPFLSVSSYVEKLYVAPRAFSRLMGSRHITETLSVVLDASTDLRDLRKAHACMFTTGLGNDTYLGSKLLNHYAMHGSLHDSRLVLCRIVNGNLKLCNSVIVGYFRAGNFDEVLRLFSLLKQQGISLGSLILTFCLKSCIELKMIEKGREIHASSVKTCLSLDRFVGSSLVSLYAHFGAIEDAWKAFTEILFKDMIAYSTMVAAYAHISDCGSQNAFDVARCMLREGFSLNRVTLISLLQAATQMEGNPEGRSIHCYAFRRGIDLSDEILATSLMGAYIRRGKLTNAISIFNKMKRSTASWNALIHGLICCGHLYEALEHFFTMIYEESILPDKITLTIVLSACSELMCSHLAAGIHGYILRTGILFDLVLTTTLIDAYFQCHDIEKARKLFDELSKRDIITYNVTISGYLQNGLFNSACQLTHEMLTEDIQLNPATLLCLLSSCSDPSLIRIGQSIHGYVLRHCLFSQVEISNQLLHMYAECGCFSISREIFVRMRKKDLISWTTMMMTYVNYGFADEALSLFPLMQKAGEKLDSVTLVSLLQAFSLLGRVKEIKEIHGLMYRNQMNADVGLLNPIIMAYSRCGKLDTAEIVFNSLQLKQLVSWNTMIASYGMHGLCAEAIELFHYMRKENVAPDSMTFTSLLSACSHAGFVQEGWHIFHSMNVDYQITPTEEHYTCIVDMLARSGKLQEAYEFIKQHPVKDCVGALSSLVSACRTHGNTELGVLVGKELLQLASEKPSSYALVSNIYVDSGKWDNAAKYRVMVERTGLKKLPGYSIL